MELILQPTTDQSARAPGATHSRVAVTAPSDDLTLDDLMESLVRPALLAAGYAPASVEAALDPDGESENARLRQELEAANLDRSSMLSGQLALARQRIECERSLAKATARGAQLELDCERLKGYHREAVAEVLRLHERVVELERRKPIRVRWGCLSFTEDAR